MNGRVLKFPGRAFSADEGREEAERVLAIPCADRRARAKDLRLDEPEIILAICGALRRNLDISPTLVRDESSFFFDYLSTPRRAIGLFDEREYFLGELALLAGTANRILAHREDARRWLDRSEANFRLTVNAVADWSRVSYQRLAILLEERRFDVLLEQLPNLIESFRNLEMAEDVLKCRFLEGSVHLETGDLSLAAETYESICREAGRLGNDRLLASAYVNMVHVHGMAGHTSEALRYAHEAMPVLRRLDNKVELGKVNVAIGFALRAQGDTQRAVDAYRQAQHQFSEIEMLADVAALHLTIADLLLDLKQEGTALVEVLAALPLIDQYKLVPEGAAAMTLLRESVRQQKVNHQALRDLHGFFEGAVS